MMGARNQSLIAALLEPVVNSQDAVFRPMETVILHTDQGTVFVPNPYQPGRRQEMPLSRGVAIGWSPCPEIDGALIVMSGGNPLEPTEEAIAFTISRQGLKAIIGSLQSINRQLDGLA